MLSFPAVEGRAKLRMRLLRERQRGELQRRSNANQGRSVLPELGPLREYDQDSWNGVNGPTNICNFISLRSKFTIIMILRSAIQWFLGIFSFQNIVLMPQRRHEPPNSPFLPGPGNHTLTSCCYKCAYSRLVYKWHLTTCGILSLASAM